MAGVNTKSMEGLINDLGVPISVTRLSNTFKAEHDLAIEEKKSILQAGVTVNQALQMDCTGNVQKG